MASTTTQTTPQSAITIQELNAFHNIDRILFSRLVFNLQRDPAESMQVVSFLLWLEQTKNARNLVYATKEWHDSLVNHLANEAVQFLNCIEIEEFNVSSEPYQTPLIQGLTQGRVNLRYVHENRVRFISGIAKIVADVCIRAFEDIMEQIKLSQENADVENRIMNSLAHIGMYNNYYIPTMMPEIVNYGPTVTGNIYQVPGAQAQRQIPSGEIEGSLGPLQITSPPPGAASKGTEKEVVIVPEDDRTIFLTFSKGYPISETEVREFFKKKFGDCIEAVLMQEVPAGEQSLFARMVVQTPASMEKILGGNRKAKFSINGKHLWARKYVPKTQKSPPQSPPGTASPTAT